MLTPQIEPHRYKHALVETLMRQRGEFHVVAQLAPPAPCRALEDALYAWVGRINRHYIGRNWTAPHRAEDRMNGGVFFEESGGFHAHMVVRPPVGASGIHFLMNAPFWFQPYREPLLRRFYPTPIDHHGQMRVIPIGPDPSDLRRVLSYAAKGLERGDEHWKFLDELQPRQLA
jgi:hypothetical protein